MGIILLQRLKQLKALLTNAESKVWIKALLEVVLDSSTAVALESSLLAVTFQLCEYRIKKL